MPAGTVVPVVPVVPVDRRLLLARLPELAAGEAVFVPGDPPRAGRMAFWTPGGAPPDLGVPPEEFTVVRADGEARVTAVPLPVDQALPLLTRCRALGADGSGRASAATAFWGAAAVLGLSLLARGRVRAGRSPEGADAWQVGPLDPVDDERLRTLAAAMPPDARAAASPARPCAALNGPGSDASAGRPPEPSAPGPLPAAEPLLLAFLDAVADSLTRTRPPPAPAVSPAPAVRAPRREPEPEPPPEAADEPAEAGVEVSLRLEPDGTEPVRAVVQLRSLADPTVLADAADVWAGRSTAPEAFGTQARARADTRRALRRAARVWPPAARLVTRTAPTDLELSDDEARALLGDAATRLAATGVAVHWPRELVRELTATGVLEPARKATRSAAEGLLSSGGLVDFRWRVALGGRELTGDELERLVEGHRPIVRLRDQWVVADPELVRRLRRAARSHPPALSPVAALGAALSGTAEVDGDRVPVTAAGALEDLRARVTGSVSGPNGGGGPPAGLAGTLRAYQLRGLDWLDAMTGLGLGGCLADDMGLGKTVTLIALHLRRQARADAAGPTLVVCPASLLGNWEREIHRFAPAAPVRRYHGAARDLTGLDTPTAGSAERSGSAGNTERAERAERAERTTVDAGFVLTTYGTMRRDAERLAAQPWGLLVADEAQHVKNPHAHTARALRTIPARARVALTGTPVENNLSELWAILDWTTPGLLGTLGSFRDHYARAVEGDRDAHAARQLADLVRPFLLRRRKSDPGVAPELPPKTETDQPVSLTREQVSLYEALVRELMPEIEEKAGGGDGMARRGLVMKLLTGLKQICNHPAQYLKEPQGTRLRGRSGKLELLDELLTAVLSDGNGGDHGCGGCGGSGDGGDGADSGGGDDHGSVLVFTQYVAMGRLIERHLHARGVDTLFLHGGTPVGRRQEMVDAFQSGRKRVFLLSLKAAGTGLNLTRAAHVIHYDRWWNPAVEDQATDRAHRIGQTRPVQVHKLVAEGTVEDRIARLLLQKRELADSVLVSAEAAFSELTTAELADLVRLRRPGSR